MIDCHSQPDMFHSFLLPHLNIWLINWQIDKSVTFFLPVWVFPWTVSAPLRSPFTSPRCSLTLFVTFTGEVYRLLSPWGWGWSLTGQSGVNVVYVVVIWIPEIKEIPINFMLDISNSSGCVKFFYFFYEACRAYRFFFLKIKLIILYHSYTEFINPTHVLVDRQSVKSLPSSNISCAFQRANINACLTLHSFVSMIANVCSNTSKYYNLIKYNPILQLFTHEY